MNVWMDLSNSDEFVPVLQNSTIFIKVSRIKSVRSKEPYIKESSPKSNENSNLPGLYIFTVYFILKLLSISLSIKKIKHKKKQILFQQKKIIAVQTQMSSLLILKMTYLVLKTLISTNNNHRINLKILVMILSDSKHLNLYPNLITTIVTILYSVVYFLYSFYDQFLSLVANFIYLLFLLKGTIHLTECHQ